jgi:hypothetical protein
VPVDFDSYTIPDEERYGTPLKGALHNNEKIWRISSLTASIDDATKLLVLPQPESKRQVKIADTKYRLDTYENLLERANMLEEGLIKEKEVVKRFEDKTSEEILQD